MPYFVCLSNLPISKVSVNAEILRFCLASLCLQKKEKENVLYSPTHIYTLPPVENVSVFYVSIITFCCSCRPPWSLLQRDWSWSSAPWSKKITQQLNWTSVHSDCCLSCYCTKNYFSPNTRLFCRLWIKNFNTTHAWFMWLY